MSFSPDGIKLAYASKDKTIKIWNVNIGNEIITIFGYFDVATCLYFSCEGN